MMETHTTRLALLVSLALWLPLSLTAQFKLENIPRPDGGGDAMSIERVGAALVSFGSGNAFYRSDDQGLSWQKLPFDNPSGSAQKLVGLDGKLYTFSYQQVGISSDVGLTWQQKAINTQIFISSLKKLIALPSGVLLAATHTQLLRSEDQGVTWVVIKTLPGSYAAQFTYDTASAYVYFATEGSNYTSVLTRSTDEGKTWQQIYSATNVSFFQNIPIAIAADGALFTNGASDGKIARSKDGGMSWQFIQVALGNLINNPVESITITDSGRIFARIWYQIFFSDDGGDTWKEVPQVWGKEIDDLKNVPGVGLFCNWNSIYRSSDNGTSWQFASTGIRSGIVNSIAIKDDNNFFVKTNDGLFSTTDGGASWAARYLWGIQEYNFSSEQARIHCATDGSLYLATYQALIRSDDESAPWKKIEPVSGATAPERFSVHPITGQLFYADGSSLYISSDKGVSWKLHPNNANLALSRVLFSPDGRIYGQNVYGHLLYTKDDFATWDTLKINGQPTTFKVRLGHHGFLLGYNGYHAYRSFDNGMTWDTITIPLNASFYYFSNIVANNRNLLFGESFSDFGYSSDHGLSWQAIDDGDYYPYEPSFVISPSQRLYITDDYTFVRTTTPTSSLSLLEGHVFQDENKDCDRTQTEPLRAGFHVRAEQNGQSYFGTSNPTGHYLMPTGSGDWKLSVLPPNPLWAGCSTTVSVPANPSATIVAAADAGLELLQLCPWMEVSISALFLRRCFPGEYIVHYCNNGTAAAENAYIEVTLDPFLKFLSADKPLTQSGQLLTIPLGTVEPGKCGDVHIRIEVSCAAEIGQVHCSQAHIYPDSSCILTWTGAQLRLRAECLGDRARFTIRNEGAAMQQPLEYAWNTSADPLVKKANFQLAAQQEQSVEIPTAADGNYVYFRHALEKDYPFGSFRSATVSGCPLGGTGAAIPNVEVGGDALEPFLAEDCQANIGAFDPNDKQGAPIGLQDKHYIERNQRLSYLIRFQNTGTDTAFNIVVRDTLSRYLDPATLRLEAASHPLRMDLSGQGDLTFTFKDILLPDSNLNEVASHGFLRYSISPYTDAPEGVRVENRAAIYFDFNEPVLTNTTWHTLGLPFVVTNTNTPPAQNGVSVQPNPFQSELVFTAALPTRSLLGARFELLNLIGQVVQSGQVAADPFRCSTGQLPNGAYLFRFSDEAGQTIGIGKVLKNR